VTYLVKEIFYTLQGEGANAGRPAVLLRFSGCNLWSGREADRVTAKCRFCDTDFLGTDGAGGGSYRGVEDLADAVQNLWPVTAEGESAKLVVCTGGEPLLQLDEALIAELRVRHFTVAVETNGTIPVPVSVDWICVSPKAGTQLVQTTGNELKLVYPQEGLPPRELEHLEFEHFFLQPMDGPNRDDNTRLARDYCLGHPRWRLSLQIHKFLGLP
jgi:7-carboxy-7-deazaguanine synthase (Cx14CxxC type)